MKRCKERDDEERGDGGCVSLCLCVTHTTKVFSHTHAHTHLTHPLLGPNMDWTALIESVYSIDGRTTELTDLSNKSKALKVCHHAQYAVLFEVVAF